MMTRTIRVCSCLLIALAALLLQAAPAAAQAQSNAGDLIGVVSDPTGARIAGATVTAKNIDTGLIRAATTDGEGNYRLLLLPPGRYEILIEKEGFRVARNPEFRVQIGQRAEWDVALQVGSTETRVEVTSEARLVETTVTAVTQTITEQQKDHLPINERNYIDFSKLDSSVRADSAQFIGAAPTSGLNFGGQRARSNQVSVDGADATDNSINGVRSTVSQEAVQEFQIVTNSYMPEFGRATGGVVNIVTKSGGNDLHGNVFAFIRNRHFQARNPFSTVEDPGFTRFEGGLTLGGPIKRDKTFFFFAYEGRRREEEGFSSIGADNFGLVLNAGPLTGMTPEQAQFVTSGTCAATLGGACNNYIGLAAGGGQNALFGANGFTGATFPSSGAPLPASFVVLNALRGNYPVDEATDFWSVRLDHRFSDHNNFFTRLNFSPSTVRGIVVTAQNQTFGQNSWSRSSEQSFHDFAGVAQLVSVYGNWLNEARFQFARRGLSYTPSRAPGRPGEPLGGQGLGVDILGFAHFGREPFSRVDRIERRFQWTDNVTYLRGTHTIKFGADINFIQVRPRYANDQVFELNFGGTMRFSGLPATTFGFPAGTPGLTAVQTYGLGLPSSLVQGIGDSFSSFNNTPLAFYVQDSWRVRPNFTLNFGVRWDGELTPELPAFNAFTAQAEELLGVQEGIPRDWNNWQPRIGLAWDPWSDGKTVLRAAYGIHFDHPLLALAFNSDTADGAQSTQQIIGGGTPCATSILVNPACLNAASIFQGILNAPPNFGYLASQQRFDPFFPNSIFINQNFCPQVSPDPDPARFCNFGLSFPLPILPFTLPVARDFVFGYAQQWNASVERELVPDLSFSVSYQGVKGSHLNRPRNINAPDPALLVRNAANAITAGLAAPGANPLTIQVPVMNPGFCAVFVPGMFCLTNMGAPIATPAAFNFFRPSGPNLAFTGAFGVPDANILALATLAGYPVGPQPGFFVPFSDVLQQESSGASIYHGLSVNLRKRFSRHYMFLGSYTWSHAIDDSTDLQTLLAPQDNRRPDLERGNSSFDQRHRFVFSAVFESPYTMADEGWAKKVFADFQLAPVFQVASGRPFTVLAGQDTNLDFGPFTDRPTVVPAGTPGAITSPFLDGVAFLPATNCPATSTPATVFWGCTGTLGRNTFTKPETWSLDLRVARTVTFTERWNMELIADVFNLFNRFNVGDVNPLCDPIGGRCIANQPTAALATRQFQFGVKLNW